MSFQEDKLYNYLDSVLNLNVNSVIRNWRPKQLLNKKTNRKLEIDIYLSTFKVGFEYQGGVHFNTIKRYNNDSDKSRYNDNLKHEISLSKSEKHKIAIIEIFECDLSSNIFINILNRIINTRNYYAANKIFAKACRLECLRLYWLNRIDIQKHRTDWKRGYIYCAKKNQTKKEKLINPKLIKGFIALLLNYDLMLIFSALGWLSKRCDKEYSFTNFINDRKKDKTKIFIDESFNIINNISDLLLKNCDMNGDWKLCKTYYEYNFKEEQQCN